MAGRRDRSHEILLRSCGAEKRKKSEAKSEWKRCIWSESENRIGAKCILRRRICPDPSTDGARPHERNSQAETINNALDSRSERRALGAHKYSIIAGDSDGNCKRAQCTTVQIVWLRMNFVPSQCGLHRLEIVECISWQANNRKH